MSCFRLLSKLLTYDISFGDSAGVCRPTRSRVLTGEALKWKHNFVKTELKPVKSSCSALFALVTYCQVTCGSASLVTVYEVIVLHINIRGVHKIVGIILESGFMVKNKGKTKN